MVSNANREEWEIAVNEIYKKFPTYKYRNYTIAFTVAAILMALITATDGFQEKFSYYEGSKFYLITKIFIFVASLLGIMDCWRLKNKNVILYIMFLYFSVIFNPLDKIMVFFDDKMVWRINDLMFVGFASLYYKYLSTMGLKFAIDDLNNRMI